MCMCCRLQAIRMVDYKAYTLTSDTLVVTSPAGDAHPSEFAGSSGQAANPSDPSALTSEQMQRSVEVYGEARSSVVIRLIVTGTGSSGRNFQFASASSLIVCPPVAPPSSPPPGPSPPPP
eukprot:7384302-Prymnesium_polylepis.2